MLFRSRDARPRSRPPCSTSDSSSVSATFMPAKVCTGRGSPPSARPAPWAGHGRRASFRRSARSLHRPSPPAARRCATMSSLPVSSVTSRIPGRSMAAPARRASERVVRGPSNASCRPDARASTAPPASADPRVPRVEPVRPVLVGPLTAKAPSPISPPSQTTGRLAGDATLRPARDRNY